MNIFRWLFSSRMPRELRIAEMRRRFKALRKPKRKSKAVRELERIYKLK